MARQDTADMIRRTEFRPWLAVVLLWLLSIHPATASDALVFAAASLKPALDEIAGQPWAADLPKPAISYAASSQLARQIEHGARADLFISADREWMDHLVQRGRVRAEDRVELLGNALVLIAPLESVASVRLQQGVDLTPLLGAEGRLAMAEPNTVPAGRYGRAALTWLGAWPQVRTRIVSAENVRAALNFVRRREAPLGIVYRSDAVMEPSLRVVDTFPAASHPEIVYPAAVPLDAGNADAGRQWLALLRGPDAAAVFERHGFDVLSHTDEAVPELPASAVEPTRPQ